MVSSCNSKSIYSQPLEPVIQQTWWHIDDTYFPHPYHDIRLVMDIQVPVYYSHPYKSLRLRWIGGDYFGGMRIYGRNNGHKEIAFIEEIRISRDNSIPDGISLFPVYSDFPTIEENGTLWYHLKLEIQYQIYDEVYDGTYEGLGFKPMWKKYPHNLPSSEEIQFTDYLKNIEEYAKLIPKLRFSIIPTSSFLEYEKTEIDSFANHILTDTNQLYSSFSSKYYAHSDICTNVENLKKHISYIEDIIDYIKNKHKPVRDTYVYRKKLGCILSSIKTDLKKIVKLSKTFNDRYQRVSLRRRIKRKLESVFSSISVSCHEYLRNSIHVELLLRGVFQPEFYISTPPSWRIGTIRALDDYLIGLKHEGRDIKVTATIEDSSNSSERDVKIPINPPFISRVEGGRREYKIVPTEDGLKLYQSLRSYPNKLKSIRIEYITQVSNTMSLFSLIPLMFIVVPIVFLFGSLINPSFHPTNIALCVSFVVMYLSYTYSYISIKGKRHDIPHKRIYWAALVCVTIYVIISLVVNISSLGDTDVSTLYLNINNLFSFIAPHYTTKI